MSTIRRYLIAGLLVWLPLAATLLVLNFIVGLLDKTIVLLPDNLQPQNLIGMHLPGLGVIISIIILLLTGMLVTNFLGRKLLSFWHKLIARIPLVRTIYISVKQVFETLFSQHEPAFRKVLLVEYPRKGMWSVAFQTGRGWKQAAEHIGEDDLVTIFVPTTPNPTSGFLILLPKKDTIELDISVDQALRLVISLGVVAPHKLVEGEVPEVEQ